MEKQRRLTNSKSTTRLMGYIPAVIYTCGGESWSELSEYQRNALRWLITNGTNSVKYTKDEKSCSLQITEIGYVRLITSIGTSAIIYCPYIFEKCQDQGATYIIFLDRFEQVINNKKPQVTVGGIDLYEDQYGKYSPIYRAEDDNDQNIGDNISNISNDNDDNETNPPRGIWRMIKTNLRDHFNM